MQICHKSVKTVTGTLCSGTVVPYHRNSFNSFVKMFFKAMKYEKLYLELPENGTDLHKCCSEFVNFYNNSREHSSLDYTTPAKIFNKAA